MMSVQRFPAQSEAIVSAVNNIEVDQWGQKSIAAHFLRQYGLNDHFHMLYELQ